MFEIVSHELKYYFKNSHELIYIYGFFALLIFIFPMGLRQQLHVLPELAPSMIWLALVASIGLGAMNLFQRDADNGLWEIYLQLPHGLGGIVLGKWLAFYIATILPIITIIPLVLMLFGLPMFIAPHYMVGVLAGGGAISIIASLAAAIAVGLERARAVVLLMLLPLSVPVIIFGSQYLQSPAHLWQPSLMFLLAFSIFLLPILVIAGGSCIRASN